MIQTQHNFLDSLPLRPLVTWILDALTQGKQICFLDVPAHFNCDESAFEAIMEEIIVCVNHGQVNKSH
jgi:hypothetical protein